MITYTEQLAEAVREFTMRKQVYPRLVTKGTLRQAEADRRLVVMQAIIDTLTQLAQKERLV